MDYKNPDSRREQEQKRRENIARVFNIIYIPSESCATSCYIVSVEVIMTAVAFFFLALLAYGHGKDVQLEELTLSNGLNRGEWGPTDNCAAGSWVSSFEVKYEAEGHIDNTGVNAVKLYCQDTTGTITSSLISKEGSYGLWEGIRSCKVGHYMTGMRGDVMPDQGTFGDDEGIVNLEMKCSDGTILNGRYGLDGDKHEQREGMDVAHEHIMVDGREVEAVHVQLTQKGKLGDYSMWADCTSGSRICGLVTQVEHESAVSDDAGCCNLVMYCCPVTP